jgi:hypothetical protein
MAVIRTKSEAVDLARRYGWTKADAERAIESLDLSLITEEEVLVAMAKFAGPELENRQRLQAAQKGQVTKKKKELQKFVEKINEYEEKQEKERSAFMKVIIKIYPVMKRFGLEDPWIEVLIDKYKGYIDLEDINEIQNKDNKKDKENTEAA